MKKFIVLMVLLVATATAQAQFEKGKWVVNPSLTGLNLSHNTGVDKTSFGLEGKGGAFLADNLALLVNLGAQWNGGNNNDVYKMGVGARYYLDRLGIFMGADVHVKRANDNTRFGCGLEAGYAFFLSRTVTIEPAAFWDINSKQSEFGLKIGFGLYF